MSGAGTSRSTIPKPTNELEGKGTARMAKETPSRPKSTPQKTTAELGKGEGKRKTGNNCSELSYHIFTRNYSATLILQSEGIYESSVFSGVTVYIKVKSCPCGFEQSDGRQ